MEKATRKLSKRIRSIMFLFPAWFAPTFKLRTFFHIMRGADIHPTVEIGYMCHLDNLFPEHVHMLKEANVAAGCVFLAHDNSLKYTRDGDIIRGDVTLKERCFIGINVIVHPSVTIGKRAIVGSGSVVTKDVPDDCVAVGVPAKVIKRMAPPENE